ncbi:MAG TPA: YdeI/OmpD-associated family protein [Mycobacteriales bacterium]|nr:YdeI/OmpD-associated family protein [Mycobacteriales bacterium]
MAFADAAAWTAWLAEHHEDGGVWVKLAKKDSGITSITYAEAVEVALCFGWIDGQVRRFDGQYYVQRFTPRRSRSRWSKINVAKAEQLITRGEMRGPGLRQVEAAKADGRWAAAYDSPSTAVVPADLQEAIDGSPAARRFFDSLDAQNRYAILHRLQEAKRPETRARRIAQYVVMLEEGRRLHD